MIRLLFLDVDGTLTDGSITCADNGELVKCFFVRDGLAIKHFLPRMGIIPIVLTGRESLIVNTRCQELGITNVIQGVKNKAKELTRITNDMGVMLEEVAYIGDDINDYECLRMVGYSGCPNDADDAVKRIVTFVADSNGGRGAVREFIEWIGVQLGYEEDYYIKWVNE